jgi:octaprenyl-diphosphate synthase
LDLSEIYAPFQEDLANVETRLKQISKADSASLTGLLEHSLRSNGKRIRPVLTVIAGKFFPCNYEKLISMATAVEILHTATLIHDDSIDKSAVRRGRPTVNALWSDEKAVLLGDYLFAEAGALTATTNNLRAIKLFADTLKTISSGELNQSFNAFNLNQSHAQYFQRVAQKTAALFSMATETGAAMSEAPEEAIQILISYGYNLGIAFQIVDDILDFIGTEAELGKPSGSDLTQGTITLPSMLLLERYPDDNPLLKLAGAADKQPVVDKVISMVCNSSIIQECYQEAAGYCQKARKDLNRLPDNGGRRSLTDLADFITLRKK